VGARFSAPVQTGPGAHQASCTMGTGSFPGVESGRGVTLIPHPLLSAFGHERVELYLYSPYGAYGLYRASVPVEGCLKIYPPCIDHFWAIIRNCSSSIYLKKKLGNNLSMYTRLYQKVPRLDL